MLKPKNISIKKVTETVQPFTLQKNSRNSRKSLKMPKRDFSSQNPSPINIMKRAKNNEQYEEEVNSDINQSKGSQDHSNFIKYINGYLNQLDNDSRSRKELKGSRHSKIDEMEAIRKKINKEKQINRNMQKNIVQFQRILLQRTEKLDLLEQHMRKLEQKQNVPRNSQKCMHRQSQKQNMHVQNSELIASEVSESEPNDDQFSRYRQRRKTEMPNQIQRMISKTMALRPQKYSKQRI